VVVVGPLLSSWSEGRHPRRTHRGSRSCVGNCLEFATYPTTFTPRSRRPKAEAVLTHRHGGTRLMPLAKVSAPISDHGGVSSANVSAERNELTPVRRFAAGDDFLCPLSYTPHKERGAYSIRPGSEGFLMDRIRANGAPMATWPSRATATSTSFSLRSEARIRHRLCMCKRVAPL
jgi:hypothetical protein